MAKSKVIVDAVSTLPAAQRIGYARSKTEKLVGAATTLLRIHEANRIIVFSDTLTKQIPESYGAIAFNTFQEASFFYEIVRLCTFWDRRRSDDLEIASIPAVVDFVDHSDIVAALADNVRRMHLRSFPRVWDLSSDVDLRKLQLSSAEALQLEIATRHAEVARRQLEQAINCARRIVASGRIASIRNSRDKIAHSLEKTNLEKRHAEMNLIVSPMQWRDSAWLLGWTIAILRRLQMVVVGQSFDWAYYRAIARDHAEALWNGCRFDVLR